MSDYLLTVDDLDDEMTIDAFYGNDRHIIIYILAKSDGIDNDQPPVLPPGALVNYDEEVMIYSFGLRREIYRYFLEILHLKKTGETEMYIPTNEVIKTDNDVLEYSYSKRIYYEYILRRLRDVISPSPSLGIGSMKIGSTFIVR